MKIEGPSKAGSTQKSGKGKKAGKTDSTFGDMVASAAQETQATQATQSIAKVDALLAVQSVDAVGQGATRRKMVVRGDKILRQLDHLRLAMLTGNMSLGDMLDIADVVASHREDVTDAKMTAVLDEIDLRAQIEIAKMRKAMDGAVK